MQSGKRKVEPVKKNTVVKSKSVERKLKRSGYLFLLPWIIGTVYFFIIPFIQTIYYSVNKITLGRDRLNFEFAGISNFKYIFLEDADFVRSVVNSVRSLVTDVPVILVFSLFVALILNQRFRMRVFARALFFLPVIVASSMVIKILKEDLFSRYGMGPGAASIFRTESISAFLYQVGLDRAIIDTFTRITAHVFDLSWKSGLQILLFLSALQSIPVSYYEVCKIEGANPWDSFWKITVPVISPAILIVIIYSIIDSFTDMRNPVMSGILGRFSDLKYGFAVSSALIYFIVISIVLGIVVYLLSKHINYID